MKKIYSILLGAAVLFSSSIASAQQLPNSNFDGSWVNCVPWTSKNNTKTKGVQPQGWCISHVIGLAGTGATTVGDKVTGGYEGSAYAVKLIHTANPYMSSEIVPGYMSLGTSWATAKSNIVSVSNKDGGVFGGLAFTYKPDAISFYYQRSHGSSKPNEPASVVVYSWKGTWSQASVPGETKVGTPSTVTMIDRDKNILGMTTDQGGAVSKSADAELISYLNYSIQGDASSWTYFEQPIPYKTSSTPEKINVIISAGDYFGGSSVVGKDNTLIFDNLSLVYYSRLSALSVNGVAVPGFDSKVYNYTMAGTELPTEDQISATVMGQTATKSIAIDAEAATVTITVSNVSTDNDGQSSHTYVLQYEKAENEKVGVSTVYPGYLNGAIIDVESNENMVFAENEAKEITITEYEDGTCDFLLPNLYLATLEMSLGDILVEGATVTKGADGVATYNGFIDDMPLLGGELIADVTLNGTISVAGVVEMTINVDWDGVPIVCTFTTEPVVNKVGVSTQYPGYLNGAIIDVETNENMVFAENEEKVITITEYEDGTCDFLLPDLYLSMLEMSLGDILVEGATVTKGADGVATYEGFVDDMALLGGELFADVTLNGTISAAGVVEMTINVDWDGVPIVCTFTTNQITGVENIIIENQGNVEYYNLQGVKVANPENGVFIRLQGGKATKVVK